VERFLARLAEGGSPSKRPLAAGTLNRYRDRLSGMFKRAMRLGLCAYEPRYRRNKTQRARGRIAYLPPAHPGREAFEEEAVWQALPVDLRSLFTVSVDTGLRWSAGEAAVA